MNWQEDHLFKWVMHLKNGGVGIAPAEGVYGFVADPFNEAALQRIVNLKQRSQNKGFITLASERSDLKFIAPMLTGHTKEAVKKYWWSGCPPTTILLPKLNSLPKLLTGDHSKIAVRRPFEPYMQIYLNAWKAVSGHGLLVSTSCNISGQNPIFQTSDIPNLPEVELLTLEKPLSNTASRIYDPESKAFLR